MDHLLTPKFWACYDLASKWAEMNPIRNDLEVKVGIVLIRNLIDQQYMILLAEMFHLARLGRGAAI